jgi:hypothetical protein
MKIVQGSFFIIVLILSSCRNHTPQTKTVAQVADTAKFYPLRSFFTEQIQYVDLRNFPIYRIRITDGKKDSASLTKEQFTELAGVFLSRDLSAPGIKALYKETVFQDLSTNSITLNYQPNDQKAEVQNIDILLDESTQLVKRVFIRSAYYKGDTSVTEQCNWKANKSFQVNRTMIAGNGYTSTERNFVNWNDKP